MYLLMETARNTVYAIHPCRGALERGLQELA
ncbi:MAG: hypothetical protein QOH57_4729 [Mycobacterium sp.]|nr:hypothetical protein [Mycobacterium sp.]